MNRCRGQGGKACGECLENVARLRSELSFLYCGPLISAAGAREKAWFWPQAKDKSLRERGRLS